MIINRVRNLAPTIMLSLASVVSSCGEKASVQRISRIASDSEFKTIMLDKYSRRISDKKKIIEFNKLEKKYGENPGNYIIVDKKKCRATVYNADGDALYSSEVALGRKKGDKRGGGYRNKNQKLEAYTTPGEFSIVREGLKPNSKDKSLYGNRVLILAGDHTKAASKGHQVLALHQVPNSPMGRLRENVFNNGTLKDNRVSFGCVNFLKKSFDRMRKLIKGVSTKVYILPEEKGNSLYLEKQKDGTFKFFQRKYRFESQEKK